MNKKKKEEEKGFVFYATRITFALIFLGFLPDENLFLDWAFILAVISNFILSIIHLKKHKAKAFAIVSLVISSIMVLLFVIAFIVGFVLGVIEEVGV